jgi:hypothetical protein
VGQILLIMLLLLLLGTLSVKLRSSRLRNGLAGVYGGLMAILVIAVLLGYVPWGWKP